MAEEAEVVAGTSRSTGGTNTITVTVKVWNSNKSNGKLIAATGFRDLVQKAREKFNVQDSCVVTIVCQDGCQVDDEDAFTGLCKTDSIQSLYLLEEGEELEISDTSDQSDSGQRYQFLLENLKRKRGMNMDSDTRQKKERLTVKINIGWMHYNVQEKRYRAVRSQQGGGTKIEEVLRASSYDEILNMLKKHFFPNGKNSFGKISRMNTAIGDTRANVIARDEFNCEYIIARSKMHKLYLLTKDQLFLLESDSDSAFELPHIQFRNLKTPAVPPERCYVYYERKRTAFLMPCEHLYCKVCVTQIEASSGICAICRGAITAVGKLQD